MSQATTDHVSVAEAAKELAASADSIRRWFDDGELTGFRTPGGQRRISRLSIDRLRGATSDPGDARPIRTSDGASSGSPA